ncbi:MAG: hypothetical protein U0869_04845 [Chloroflexota bacterium]
MPAPIVLSQRSRGVPASDDGAYDPETICTSGSTSASAHAVESSPSCIHSKRGSTASSSALSASLKG